MSHHTNTIRIKAVAKALDDLNKKIVICRYKIHGIIVDIIPTNDSSVGFNNKWYPHGFNQAVGHVERGFPPATLAILEELKKIAM